MVLALSKVFLIEGWEMLGSPPQLPKIYSFLLPLPLNTIWKILFLSNIYPTMDGKNFQIYSVQITVHTFHTCETLSPQHDLINKQLPRRTPIMNFLKIVCPKMRIFSKNYTRHVNWLCIKDMQDLKPSHSMKNIVNQIA